MPHAETINYDLLKLARWRVANDRDFEKSAVVPPGGGAPPGGDPAAMGGAPPGGDPMMGGGAPGGMAPPMDPAAMGGAPPGGDPMMGGGAPPGGGAPIDPAMQMAIQQAVQQAVGGAGGGMAGGKPGAGGGKKAEQAMLDTKLWQIIKMLATMMTHQGIPVPPDIVVGAPPDPAMLQMANQDNAQSSVPGGGGDPSMGGGGGGGIPPIDPMQADPAMGGGAPKMAADRQAHDLGSAFDTQSFRALHSRSASLAALSRRRNRETAE